MAQLLSTSISGNLSIYGKTTVYGNVIPGYNGSYDLGSTGSYFRSGYFTQTVNAATLTSNAALYVYGGSALYLSSPGNIVIATPGSSGGVIVDTSYFNCSVNGGDANFNVASYINLSATAMDINMGSYVTFYKTWGMYPGTSEIYNTLIRMNYFGTSGAIFTAPFAVGVEHNVELGQDANFWVKFSLFDVTGSTSTIRGTTTSSASATVGQYLSKLAALLYKNGYTNSALALPATGVYWGNTATSRTIAGIYASGTYSNSIAFKVYNNMSGFGTGASLNIYAVGITRNVYLYDRVRMPQQ